MCEVLAKSVISERELYDRTGNEFTQEAICGGAGCYGRICLIVVPDFQRYRTVGVKADCAPAGVED